MLENYDHYISKNIKSLYARKLAAPIIYMILLVFLWIKLPVLSIAFPTEIENISSSMSELYMEDDVYVKTTINNLKFTGYTKTKFGHTQGYYYYFENQDASQCSIVLLSPSTCEEGLPSIDSVTLRGLIIATDANYNALLENLSKDLSWTYSGIRGKMSACYLSEPDFEFTLGILLIAVMIVSNIYALLSIICYILFIARPQLSPPCQKLGHFGKPSALLQQAEDELATLPQLATEDMFITENFFIETSKYGIAIIPIREIVWIYKHSTLNKLFWYHFSISYTLSITANKHVYINCPKNIKSDIDGIIDYLSEANHDILVGFSEENRLKVQSIQGDPFHLGKLLSLLIKRG